MRWAFLLSILALRLATAAPIVVKYGPPSDHTVLGTTFVAWDSLSGKPTGVGVFRPVFDNPTSTLEKLEVHVTTLLPGKMSHPVHEHPWEEILFIKEGSVDVSINGSPHTAGPGSFVFLASHDPHNATNNGTVPATYYVINFVTARVHTVANRPAVEQAVPGTLPSGVYACDGVPATPTATGSRSSILDSSTLTFKRLSVHVTTLNHGQRTKTGLIDEGEELFIVRSGVLEATVGPDACRLAAGSFFYCAPNAPRSLRNIGPGAASYLVIKVVP